MRWDAVRRDADLTRGLDLQFLGAGPEQPFILVFVAPGSRLHFPSGRWAGKTPAPQFANVCSSSSLLALGAQRALRPEGLGIRGEAQVSGETPLAIARVPSLAGSVTRASGAGCVHRCSLPSIGTRPHGMTHAFRANGLFHVSIGCHLPLARFARVRSGSAGPIPPAGDVLSTIHIALSRQNRTRIRPKIREISSGRGTPAHPSARRCLANGPRGR